MAFSLLKRTSACPTGFVFDLLVGKVSKYVIIRWDDLFQLHDQFIELVNWPVALVFGELIFALKEADEQMFGQDGPECRLAATCTSSQRAAV